MGHRRQDQHAGPRRPAAAIAGAILAASLTVAACAPGSSPAPTTSPPAATASPSPSPSPSDAAASPSPAGDVTMASKLYPYTLTVPGDAVAIAPTLATVAWDGKNQIDSGDQQTDWLGFDGGRTFFVYGAPTAASLDDFAASSQKQVAEWHGCPAEPESTADVTIGGSPARLHLFHCQGLLVMKIMALESGFGLVLNQIGPDADAATEQALLLQRIADLTWTN